MLHLKLLEKQEQANPKTSRKREIIKIRYEINEIETKTTIQRINKTKSWFFEKIRPLVFQCKRGDNNKYLRNPGNHQSLL
jgi:hypothetical protein